TAAAAAIEDQEYLRSTRVKILATRARLSTALAPLGFDALPSQANFVWCRHGSGAHRKLYEELKRRNVLIRYMNYQDFGDGLRITVGSDAEIDRLLAELSDILRDKRL